MNRIQINHENIYSPPSRRNRAPRGLRTTEAGGSPGKHSPRGRSRNSGA
jgi:hypothetical protein